MIEYFRYDFQNSVNYKVMLVGILVAEESYLLATELQEPLILHMHDPREIADKNFEVPPDWEICSTNIGIKGGMLTICEDRKNLFIGYKEFSQYAIIHDWIDLERETQKFVSDFLADKIRASL